MESSIDQQPQSHDEESNQAPVPIISVRDVTVSFGGRAPVLDKLSLDIYKGEVLGFIGPSGSGKSVLMRTILGLNKKQSGDIEILGKTSIVWATSRKWPSICAWVFCSSMVRFSQR